MPYLCSIISMTVMRKALYNILTGVALLAFASCANDDFQQNGESVSGDGRIEFTVTTSTAISETRGDMASLKVSGYTKELWLIPSVEDAAKDVTRGTQLTSTSVLEDFAVSAYLHGSTEDITEKRPDFFYNKQAVRDANTGKYGFDQDFYWPASNERLSFMAYSPYGSALAVLADAGKAQPDLGAQKINFTVASSVADQVDLMTATTMLQSPSTTGTPSVALAFEHRLAGIRFVVGQQFPTQGYIQKITLKNVYANGTYTLTDGSTPGSWSYGSRADYVALTADQELTGEVGQAITTTAQTFLMLPCTFASNDEAVVEIDYWDGYATHTVTASLAGVTWEAGKTYTYELSSQNLTKLKVKSIDFATTPSATPHSKWQTGDKVGLYVVQGKNAQGDPDGHTLRYTNIPVTCTVSTVGSDEVVTWTVDHTTAQGNVYKIPGDSYYFYYPYKEGTPEGYPNECNEVNATAPTFFSSVINSYTVTTDQSGVGEAAGNFEKSDLQVAKAIVPEDDNSNLPASTIKASMARQVGLIRMKFATSKQISTTVTCVNNGTPTNSSDKTTIYPSSNFNGNKPYLSGGVYYFFTKPGTPTTFNSVASDPNHWYEAFQFNLAAGEYTSDEDLNSNLVQDYRYQWEFVNSVYKYTYTGSAMTFKMPITGKVKMECWGASGGEGSSAYGLGAYVAGTLNQNQNKDSEFYVYVGQQGVTTSYTGAWNGGGAKGAEALDGSGGGATDIRTKVGLTSAQASSWNTTWNNDYGLRSRIMVAAGGGGSDDGATTSNCRAHAGGLNGNTLVYMGSCVSASQTEGGYQSNNSDKKGQFGYGAPNTVYSLCGGGGGYWGGGASDWGGMGGSCFISGHRGCVAIANASGTTAKTGTANSVEIATHYSGLYFENTKMIDGAGYPWTTDIGSTREQMPNPAGGYYSLGVGQRGNGYCIITVTYE